MIEKFNQVRLGQDIHSFLDNVEIESKRILTAHGLPTEQNQLTNERIYETVNNKKLIDVLRESPGQTITFKIPIDIYLAKNILNHVRAAQWQFEESKTHDALTSLSVEGVAISIGKIVRYMSIFESSFYAGKISQDKKKRKPRALSPLRAFIYEVCAKTEKGNRNYGFNDVINNIRDIYSIEIDIIAIIEKNKKVVGIKYYDSVNEVEDTRSESRIRTIISEFKKL